MENHGKRRIRKSWGLLNPIQVIILLAIPLRLNTNINTDTQLEFSREIIIFVFGSYVRVKSSQSDSVVIRFEYPWEILFITLGLIIMILLSYIHGKRFREGIIIYNFQQTVKNSSSQSTGETSDQASVELRKFSLYAIFLSLLVSLSMFLYAESLKVNSYDVQLTVIWINLFIVGLMALRDRSFRSKWNNKILQRIYYAHE